MGLKITTFNIEWMNDFFYPDEPRLKTFHFTGDDYRLRFEIEAKRRFLDLLRERFNAGVRYKNRVLKWDTVNLEAPQSIQAPADPHGR